MANPMPSPKTKTTKWILLAAVVGLVLCVVIVRLQSTGGTRHPEGANNPSPAHPQRNETRRDSEPGGPLVISSASVPPSSGSAPETAKWDGFKSLTQFQSAYADLLSACEGRELERLSCLLIGSASRVLALDDMETFALEFKEVQSNLAPGIVRDKAAAEVARSVLILNPQDALTWANSIGADALRTRTVSKVMDHIKITNPSLWEQVSKER
jgi:hypothetical protein